jgi:hypothetical protein
MKVTQTNTGLYFHEMKIGKLYHKLLSKDKHTKEEFIKAIKLNESSI